jgi:hypothetical protein
MNLALPALESFNGTGTWWKGWMGVVYTDGVKYIAENGYAWFHTDVATILKMVPRVQRAAVVFVKLKLTGTGRCTVYYEDGNGKQLYHQHYKYTSAKRNLTLVYENQVLSLPFER